MSNQLKPVPAGFTEDYDSDFDPDEKRNKRKIDADDDTVPQAPISLPKKTAFAEEACREYGRLRRFQFLGKDAYSRHKEIINHYMLCFPGSTSKLQRNRSKDKTDRDIIRENHHFLWEEDQQVDTWEKQLAKKYYDRLFKEYCLADLSLFKKNKIALRWRTEKEVVCGKGQFSCGSIHCVRKDDLRSWEVNFAYVEQNVKKNALVKLRLCPECSVKLNWCHKKKEVTKPTGVESHSNVSSSKCVVPSKFSEGEKVPCAVSSSQAGSEQNDKHNEESSTMWKQLLEEYPDVEKPRSEDFEHFLSDLLL